MATTTYYVDLVTKYTALGQSVSVGTWHAGLWWASPRAEGSLVGELAYPSYSRLPVTWATNLTNANLLQWTAGEDWGTISHFVLTNTATGVYVLAYQLVSISSVIAGSVIRVPIGNLKFVVG